MKIKCLMIVALVALAISAANAGGLDGPAVEWPDGSKHWFVNGKQHRLDGPAVEWLDGTKEWFVDGKRHRLDKPAVEFKNGESSYKPRN